MKRTARGAVAERTVVTNSELTLTETLAQLGYTHAPSSRGTYCHDIKRGDQIVFHGTAGETWDWLRERGEVRP